MQKTVQATTKNIEILQETLTDENAVITRKTGQPHTSRNVESVDGMRGVKGANLLTSTAQVPV
jgi:hypothetical protein